MSSSNLSTLVIVIALVGFSMYRRIRRTVTFQPLSARALQTRMTIFIIIGLLYLVYIAVGQLSIPINDVGLIGGLVVGAILAYYAARTTTYKHDGTRWLYRPNLWIGALVTVLFIARLAFRFSTAQKLTPVAHGTPTHVTDPLTLASFYLMVAYYILFNILIVRRSRHLELSDSVSSESM